MSIGPKSLAPNETLHVRHSFGFAGLHAEWSSLSELAPAERGAKGGNFRGQSDGLDQKKCF